MSRRRVLFPTARRLLVERSLRGLELAPLRRVLVAGSGSDPYRALFPRARPYVRLDLDPRRGPVDVRADAHSLPFAARSFDCLLAVEVVEHLARPERFAAEARRVLAPGGVLVASVPFLFHGHADPHDFGRPTREGLLRLFAGFDEVEVSAQGNRMHALSDLVTTAFAPRSFLFPLRVLNHLLVPLCGQGGKSTAPSGHLVVARRST